MKHALPDHGDRRIDGPWQRCRSAADLKMSHVRPQDATIDVELRAFAAAVSEATGGDVNINMFPASALGDYTTVQERISVGAIDMATQPAAAGC